MDTQTQPDIDKMSPEELDAYFAQLETLDEPTSDETPEAGSEVETLDEPQDEPGSAEPEAEPEVAEPVAQVPVALDAKTLELVQSLQARIAELEKAPKNKVESKPATGKVYERLGEFVGKAPQQQRDLADIIAKNFPIGKPFSETELYAALELHQGEYYKLATSVQHVTYLFRYYRGIKDGGFIARGFLKSN